MEQRIHHLSFLGPNTWPFQPPKTLRFKGKTANFEAKNSMKQRRDAKRTNGTHFTRVQPPSLVSMVWLQRSTQDAPSAAIKPLAWILVALRLALSQGMAKGGGTKGGI